MVFLSIADKKSSDILWMMCKQNHTIPTEAVRIALDYYSKRKLQGLMTKEEALNEIKFLNTKKKKIERRIETLTKAIEPKEQNDLKQETETIQ